MARDLDDDFDRLLQWLDPDRERAGQKYEDIRRKLIKFFARRGFTNPEDLADEVIDRVTRKVAQIAPTYVGDPALFFFGVARKLLLELDPPPFNPKPLPPPDPPEVKERNDRCLRSCMNHIDQANRDLILEYFQDQGRTKIDHRKKMADRLGIPLNSLRMRIHRIKDSLAGCVIECVTKAEALEMPA